MNLRALAIAVILLFAARLPAASPTGTVETRFFDSKALAENRVGLELHRSLKVYLPPSYARGGRRYPVLYMLHGLNWSNERMFAPGSPIASTFDTAIPRGTIRGFHGERGGAVRRLALPHPGARREPRDHG